MASLGQSLGTVNRVFVKRTRRGQVKTFVRQQYLRDDLPTGSPHLDEPKLEPRLMGSTYLVLDTNVVLHQIDLLERPVLRDVIILQTVLDEVRHNKMSVHKRLRALVDDPSRRFHVFSNESHRETFTRREHGESPNDRNDRAIRAAASWYSSQLGPSGPKVLLITNDRDNLRKAVESGLNAQMIHTYVRTLPEAAELQELLALPPDESDAADTGGGRMTRPAGRYAAHISMSEMTRGLQVTCPFFLSREARELFLLVVYSGAFSSPVQSSPSGSDAIPFRWKGASTAPEVVESLAGLGGGGGAQGVRILGVGVQS
jgi:exosome complex exonuclease DIS3/RRP44